jgi:hypothetical protein
MTNSGRSPAHALRISVVLVLVGSYQLAGCSTRGSEFPIDKVPRIEEHETTVEEVTGWFGNPVKVRREASGITIYRYIHEEATTRDTGVLSRMGAFIGRFFGFGGYGSPLNVRYRNETHYDLTIFFDPDGIVTSYVYERTDIPSKQIY